MELKAREIAGRTVFEGLMTKANIPFKREHDWVYHLPKHALIIWPVDRVHYIPIQQKISLHRKVFAMGLTIAPLLKSRMSGNPEEAFKELISVLLGDPDLTFED